MAQRSPSTLRLTGDGAMVRTQSRRLGVGALVETDQRQGGGQPNAVHTASFTALTWLPKSLYAQFHRAANVYFVCIAIFSTVPWVGAKWAPKVMTVVLILLAQALKDLYEDMKRRFDDQTENSRLVPRYDPEARIFAEVTWAEVGVGDVLLIQKATMFPADMLIVASAEPSGVFYVATKSLDGETNLKERQAPPLVHEMLEKELPDDDASSNASAVGDVSWELQTRLATRLYQREFQVELEAPHPHISEMNCKVRMRQAEPAGVNKSNFALRGCELQNTGWAIGVACYVGSSTKVRLNSFPSPHKSSELERFLNKCVLYILGFLFVVSFYFSIGHAGLGENHHAFYETLVIYLVILYPLLPMTLYIAFEVLHLIIGWQIDNDPLMVSRDTNIHAKTRNTSIVEELGQVDFVFSDKTGTLTANEMRFAFCYVEDATLGPFLFDPVSGRAGPGAAEAQRAMAGHDGERRSQNVRSFFNALAVCHTVKLDEDGTYQGESPDEVALVEAAKQVRVELVGRDTVAPSSVVHRVKSPWGTESHEITHVLGFTSDRKRMSVVAATPDGGAIITTKGADSVMEGLMPKPLPLGASRALSDFSRQGLRTLIVAHRVLPPADFAAWQARWNEANGAMEDREARLDSVSASAEVGLEFLGVTALEDRLQDHVPATIALLREAEIRVWVLTGDKVETALEIAKSCRLIDSGMHLIEVKGASSTKECIEKLRAGQLEGGGPQDHSTRGMVLDGQSVGHILEDKKARQALYNIAIETSSCICCRLSPMQKRELVELVREHDTQAITLSIGDGANDVPMIQGAHVGIGVRGREGSAAVQASDMAISQFSFLGNLLLCHGRKSYRRLSTFLNFFVYKSMLLGWSYIIYAHSMLFSGEGAYPQWLDVVWNPLTSCAVVLMLASDVDIKDEVAVERPELYSPGPRRELFNLRVFAFWMLLATLQGGLAWVATVYTLTTRPERVVRPLPAGGPFWQASFTAFTIAYIIVHLKLWKEAERPLQLLGAVALAAELLAFIPVALALDSTLAPSKELVGAPSAVAKSPEHLLCLVLVPLAAVAVDAAATACRRYCLSHRSPRGHSRQLLSSSEDTASSDNDSSTNSASE